MPVPFEHTQDWHQMPKGGDLPHLIPQSKREVDVWELILLSQLIEVKEYPRDLNVRSVICGK